MEGRKAGGHEQQLPVVDQRGHVLLGRPFDDPVLLAVVRVVAGHALCAGKHHLRPPVDAAHQRRAVTADAVLARDFPDRLTRGAIQGD